MPAAHPVKTRTLVVALIIVVVATFAPAVVVGALGWTSVLPVAMMAGLAASMATAMGRGWRTALAMAAPYAIFSALVVWTVPYPLAVAVAMGAAAFLRGLAASTGLHNAVLVSVVALGFLVAQPPQPQLEIAVPVFTGLVVLATVLWVTLVSFLARRWVPSLPLTPLSWARTLIFSAVLAVLVGIATWFVADLHLQHTGGWIILTILVVFQPYLQDGMRKAFARAGGTFLGFLIAILIGLVTSNAVVLYVVGTIFIVVAMYVMLSKRPYWLYATFLTPSVVLFDGANSSVLQTAEERLGATMIAVVGTMAVILALTPLAKYVAERYGVERY